MDALRVGVHWSTAVSGRSHRVAQVFCSALPLSYSRADPHDWKPLAVAVLRATYEATLYVAAIKAATSGRRQVRRQCTLRPLLHVHCVRVAARDSHAALLPC
jgi:hypothetical protein